MHTRTIMLAYNYTDKKTEYNNLCARERRGGDLETVTLTVLLLD